MSRSHPFDEAIALQRLAADTPSPDTQVSAHYAGSTHAGYWNMVGPFGGLTAAVALNAVLQHPALLGEPIALTVNFAAAVAEGAFEAEAVPVRTNRSTQHWVVTLRQSEGDGSGIPQACTTATVVTALRRDTWAASDSPMPTVPAPEQVLRADRSAAGVAWLQRYAVQPVDGDLPADWDGQGTHSRTTFWLRDEPPRPLDFCSLAALADVFFPRVWLRRATRVPAGTVSMTVYFHASAAQLAEASLAGGPTALPLLARATGQEFRHGFFDQSGALWRRDGLLLATTHQIVYFKA